MLKRSLLTAAVMLASPAVVADDDSFAFEPTVYAGLTFGGDDLFHPGDLEEPGSKSAGNAGGLLSLAAGGEFNFPNTIFSLRSMFGVHIDEDYDRKVVETLALWKVNKWQFGGGVTYHLAPNVDANFEGDNGHRSFSGEFYNAFGATIELDYWLSDQFAMGGRYTNIKYKRKDASADNSSHINGNHVGIYAIYKF